MSSFEGCSTTVYFLAAIPAAFTMSTIPLIFFLR